MPCLFPDPNNISVEALTDTSGFGEGCEAHHFNEVTALLRELHDMAGISSVIEL